MIHSKNFVQGIENKTNHIITMLNMILIVTSSYICKLLDIPPINKYPWINPFDACRYQYSFIYNLTKAWACFAGLNDMLLDRAHDEWRVLHVYHPETLEYDWILQRNDSSSPYFTCRFLAFFSILKIDKKINSIVTSILN